MARPVAVSITLSDADRAVPVGCNAATDAEPKPFVRSRTADEILGSAARYGQRTTDSHH